MPVFFGRDISRFSEFISVWYGDAPMLRAPSKVCSTSLSDRILSNAYVFLGSSEDLLSI